MHRNYTNKNLASFPNEPNPAPVSVLSLQNNLIKSIPPQIKEYINLTQLHVYSNKLEYVPKEIGNLKKLTHLYLFDNELKKVPSEIFGLPALSVLRLEKNKLENLPLNIGNTKSLSQLYLSQNSLKKIPDKVCDFTGLTHLFFADNKLKNVPFQLQNLKKLVHLDLSNNDLTWLPEELNNIPSLQKIILTGNNKLQIPPNHANLNAKQVLDFVFKNQKPPEPDLNTRKAYIFRSTSLPELNEAYKVKLNELLIEDEIETINIDDLRDIDNKVTVVFLIVPYDVYKNQSFIWKVLAKCSKNSIPHYILLQNTIKDADGLINIVKGKEIDSLRKKINKNYSNKVIKFSNVNDLHTKIIDGLKQHTPQVLIKKITLKNIGHFKDLSVDFDENINCVIGENGTGKSTLLRAVAFGIVGHNIRDIDTESIEKLLRVERTDKTSDIITYCDSGSILLTYSIDGDLKENLINFNYVDDQIEITQVGDFEILSNRYNLKSLILGFPQVRSSKGLTKTDKKNLPQANVSDLIPLINNIDQNRIESFENWIINLYSEATQKVAIDKSLVLNDVDEMILINKVFSILSKITKKDISFLTIDFKPSIPNIIVSTFDVKNGIPIKLVSEGFKVIFGWIGSFLERLSEAYPMTKVNFETEKSIILIDEVDTYIHPKWQLNFLTLLKGIFTNTQFITTSHSPLVVAGLNGNQLIDLEVNNRNNVVLSETDYDGTKFLDVSSILLGYFGLDSVLSKPLQAKIDRYYKLMGLETKTDKQSKELNELENYINRSAAGKNIHDYRFMAFVNFLQKHNLNTRPKIENLEMDPEIEKELLNQMKKYQ